MSGLEGALLAVGRAVVTRVVAAWQGDRAARRERSADLVELLEPGFGDLFGRRRLARQFETVADEVAARLDRAFGPDRLAENEKLAALAEVADTLAGADLSDAALFAADVDPAVLARRLRDSAAGRIRAAGLGDAATAFFYRVLDDCAGCLVGLVLQLPAFEPRAAAETLARLSGLDAQMREVLERLPRTSLDAPTGTGRDAEFERRYLGAIADGLDRLELFGLSTRRYRPAQRLTVAYLSLSVSDDAEPVRRRGRPEMLLRGRPFLLPEVAEPVPRGGMRVEAALGRCDRVFLRGEAGSGKTTLLHWLAVTAARHGFTGELSAWNGRVPFLVTLRRYAGANLPRPEHLLDAEQAVDTVAGLMPEGWAHRVLAAGRGLLLVDGVDELPDRQRDRVRRWLERMVGTFGDTRVVVTSRPLNTTTRWLSTGGFDPVTLDRMNPADVTAFVARWHDAAADGGNLPCRPDELPGYQAALLRQLDANPHLRTLAASPLLAALVCALNLDRRTQLPRDRMGLYAAALELLLERRDVEREVPADREFPLDLRQKTELLTGLAWWLTVNGRAEMSADDAAREIGTRMRTLSEVGVTAEDALRYLVERSGVLREPVVGRIDFAHRTFQEYLAAREAAGRNMVGLLVDRAHLDTWHQTVVMAAGTDSAAFRADLLTALLDRADRGGRHARRLRLLAAACLETAPSLPEEIRSRVESALDTLIPPRNHREARTLATAGEAVLRRLPDTLDALTERAAAATIRTAALIHSPHTLDTLTRYSPDPRHDVQRELADVWQYFDPDEYARHILSNAPLSDGTLTIRSRRLLPAVHHLRNLKELWYSNFHEEVSNLRWLDDAEVLKRIDVHGCGDLDLSPLGRHHHLEWLQAHTNGEFSSLKALASLGEIK